MKTVDLSERVTATYYDDEHEEWSQKTVTISDVLDSVCDDYTVIEAEPRWIPIEQDCPERGKDVLISHNGVVSIDWLTQSEGAGYFFISGVAVQDIDAWMPSPEPYREAGE